MRNILFAILLGVFVSSRAQASEGDSCWVSFRLCELIHGTDTASSYNKRITIHLTPSSSIVPIYKSTSTEYAVKFEFYRSTISGYNEYFVRTVFFIKKDSIWNELDKDLLPTSIFIAGKRPLFSEQSICNQTRSTGNFYISYEVYFYFDGNEKR